MAGIRRILAAVKDPRASRLPAVRKAARLAAATGAELTLFHAIAEPLYVGGVDGTVAPLYDHPPDIERRTREEQHRRLERVAARLRRAGLKVAVSVAWDYPAYEAVIREASRIGAGLIVAEQHAGRHFAAGLLHLNDWELLRRSPMPCCSSGAPAPIAGRQCWPPSIRTTLTRNRCASTSRSCAWAPMWRARSAAHCTPAMPMSRCPSPPSRTARCRMRRS
ncbi:MAG: universal stress protein [Gammaproteobacteria bacterium]|nr:universal stress protein [Gammaproteobacteria bacterium]